VNTVMNLGFHKNAGIISWVAAQLTVSQEGLSSMSEWVCSKSALIITSCHEHCRIEERNQFNTSFCLTSTLQLPPPLHTHARGREREDWLILALF
jgi:hypothetical protein